MARFDSWFIGYVVYTYSVLVNVRLSGILTVALSSNDALVMVSVGQSPRRLSFFRQECLMGSEAFTRMCRGYSNDLFCRKRIRPTVPVTRKCVSKIAVWHLHKMDRCSCCANRFWTASIVPEFRSNFDFLGDDEKSLPAPDHHFKAEPSFSSSESD
ncbi:hypothetical protein ACFE04_019554 [Oxalis oulophora]